MASAWQQLLQAVGGSPPTERLLYRVLSCLLIDKEPAPVFSEPSSSSTRLQPSEVAATLAESSQDPVAQTQPVTTVPVGPVPLAPHVEVSQHATAPEGPVPLAPSSSVSATAASGSTPSPPHPSSAPVMHTRQGPLYVPDWVRAANMTAEEWEVEMQGRGHRSQQSFSLNYTLPFERLQRPNGRFE